MLSVDEAIAEAVKVCDRKWLEWARGIGVRPLNIPLRPPEKLAMPDVVPAQNWRGTWQSAKGNLPGEVRPVRKSAPNQLLPVELPDRWILPIQDAWRYCPDLHESYRAASARFHEAVNCTAIEWASPAQIPDGAAKKIAALAEQDWVNALEVVGRLAEGPGQAMMVRQLAVPGVHSKWIEKNAALLCALIGLPKSGPTDGTPLERLLRHVGLQAKEAPIHVALRCPNLRAAAGHLTAFHAPIQVLNNSTIDPPIVLIIENDELGYTITADIDGLAIIHGLGSAAPLLAALTWCHTSRVFYWGDIDRAGLSILATLRRAGINATSILMDHDTLDRLDDYAHNTDSQKDSTQIPDGLTEPERALYQQLNKHHDETREDWQLEQEAIEPSYALAKILASIATGRFSGQS